MNTKLLLVFIVLNIANVIIQTVKSIATVKCGKVSAAVINAVAYGLYTIVTVYLMCELDLYLKAGIVALCNLVGVYVVKLIEEKARKDKLWKVEATIYNQGIDPHYDDCLVALRNAGVPHNYIDANKYLIINAYCATQAESRVVKEILDQYNAKYFVSESKTL
jgi:general stress protein 26